MADNTLTTSIDGVLTSRFSQATLDLQSGFCCTDKDKRKIIRWVGCKPSVFRSQQTLFTAEDLAMCSWFQEVGTYNFVTVLLESGQDATVNINSKYVFVKNAWPTNSLETEKNVEIAVNQQPGLIGMYIPFNIGATAATNSTVYKDIYHINTEDVLTPQIKINNVSPYQVSVSMLYAN
jgi:hypothetical protein